MASGVDPQAFGSSLETCHRNPFQHDHAIHAFENPCSQNYAPSLQFPPTQSTVSDGAHHFTGAPSLPPSTAARRPRKAKSHRKRHVPVGPAGVWFQSQQQQKKVPDGPLNARIHGALHDHDGSSAAAAQTQRQLEPLSKKSDDAAGTGGGLSLCSPAWMCMQCDLDLVLPSLPPQWSESDRCAALRRCLPTPYTLIPELLRPSNTEWKLENRKLVVLVQTTHSLTDDLWTVQVTDETGASLTAWVQPRLVRDEQGRPQPKYIRPGWVWLLDRPTTILCPESSSQQRQQHHKLERIVLVSGDNLERVWSPAHAKEVSDDQFVQWLERRSIVTSQVLEEHHRAQPEPEPEPQQPDQPSPHRRQLERPDRNSDAGSRNDTDSDDELEIEFEGCAAPPSRSDSVQQQTSHNTARESHRERPNTTYALHVANLVARLHSQPGANPTPGLTANARHSPFNRVTERSSVVFPPRQHPPNSQKASADTTSNTYSSRLSLPTPPSGRITPASTNHGRLQQHQQCLPPNRTVAASANAPQPLSSRTTNGTSLAFPTTYPPMNSHNHSLATASANASFSSLSLPMPSSGLVTPAMNSVAAPATLNTEGTSIGVGQFMSPLSQSPKAPNDHIRRCGPLSQEILHPQTSPSECRAPVNKDPIVVDKPPDAVQGQNTARANTRPVTEQSLVERATAPPSAATTPPLTGSEMNRISSRRSRPKKSTGSCEAREPENLSGRKLKAPSALWTANGSALLELFDDDDDDDDDKNEQQQDDSSLGAMEHSTDAPSSVYPSPNPRAEQNNQSQMLGPSLFQMSSYSTLDLGDLFDDEGDTAT